MLFPARAGMILQPYIVQVPEEAVPRTRGDDPAMAGLPSPTTRCSPHARG